MAGYSTKLLLSFTVPSVFGILSLLWFFKKKASSSKQQNTTEAPENSLKVQSLGNLYSMKLINIKDNSTSSESNSHRDMQLKEVESSSEMQSFNTNGVSQNTKIKGKKKVSTKVPEKNTTCSLKQPTSNGCKKDNSLKRDDSKNLTNSMKDLNLNDTLVLSSENNDKTSNMKVVNGTTTKSNGFVQKQNECQQNGLCVVSSTDNSKTEYNLCPDSLLKGKCDTDARRSISSDCSSGVSDCSTNSFSLDLQTEETDHSSPPVSEPHDINDQSSIDSCLYANGHSPTNFEVDEHPALAEDNVGDVSSSVDVNAEVVEDVNYESLPTAYSESASLCCAEADIPPVYAMAIVNDYDLPQNQGAIVETASVYYQTVAEMQWRNIFDNFEVSNLKFFPIEAWGEGSGQATGFPPPALDPSELVTVYEFEIQPDDCGRLIGKGGRYVKYINKQTSAEIVILKHPYARNKKICCIQGTESQIAAALDMVRNRFPLDRFPQVTLAQINSLVPCPESLQLPLPEGVAFEAMLSCTVNAGHFFLQQPTHSTFHQLLPLTNIMTTLYSTVESPMIDILEKGNVCAAHLNTGWYRAEVVDVFDEHVRLRFLDFGGYAVVSKTSLRQIKYEFMQIPFQATECYLANAMPLDESGWSPEATSLFEELAQGQILQGCIVAYAEDKTPCVNLYKITGVSNVFINQELINAGVAQPITAPE